MESLSPSAINVRSRPSANGGRSQARRHDRTGGAVSLTNIPNISQMGTRLGNWLTREQTKELLPVPDRSTLKGKREYVVLGLLVGCALTRNELAELDVETIEQREGRWVLADLEVKGRRIRTVAIPIWVKHGINAWVTAAGIEDGWLLRSVSERRRVSVPIHPLPTFLRSSAEVHVRNG
jgi:integrase